MDRKPSRLARARHRKLIRVHFQHAIDRAKELYGLDLNIFDLKVIATMIEAKLNGSRYLGHGMDSFRKLYEVEYWGVKMRAMYCTKHKIVVTFFPRDAMPTYVYKNKTHIHRDRQKEFQ